jgi:hypothetical protein
MGPIPRFTARNSSIGDGDGEKILPARKEMGKNQSPSEMAGPRTEYGPVWHSLFSVSSQI